MDAAGNFTSVGDVRRGYENGVSPQAVLEQCLARIHAKQALNAFVYVDERGARIAAQASEQRWRRGQALSAFDGIPVAIKDNIAAAHMPISNGIGALRDFWAYEDASVVARMREAGMIVLGRLNMHEAALGATTDNPHFGATQNPSHEGFTPGGSSGGSAAAVAANLVPLTLGSDTMGSVRIPAAYCGCYGLLPTQGRLSRHGVMPLSDSLDRLGVLAQNADDAYALLALLARHDERDAQSRNLPALAALPDTEAHAEWNRILGEIFGEWSIAVFDGGEQTQAPIRAAVARVAALLRTAGATVAERTVLPVDGRSLRRAGLLVSEAEGYEANRHWLGVPGVSATLEKMLRFGAKLPQDKLAHAFERIAEARALWMSALDRDPLWLMPTAPQNAFHFSDPVPDDQSEFTVHANTAGLPAFAIPVGRDERGLPVGVQLMGPPESEWRLSILASYIGARLDTQA